MSRRKKSDQSKKLLVEIEGIHHELWDRLAPTLRDMADLAEPPPKTWVILSNHRATLREAATSIERLRAEVVRLQSQGGGG